ncbi:MAG: XdhC family protein [Cellvibrionaceae bacterium]
MYSLDLEVFSTLIKWLEEGTPSWLCTVTSTWGSAPRDVGSLMVCDDKGEQCGSLSGGCIEDDLLKNIHTGKIARDKAQFILYGESPEEAERLKLPCGGTLGVLIEPMDANEKTLSWLRTVKNVIEKRECMTRDVAWSSRGSVVSHQELKTGVNGKWFSVSVEKNASEKFPTTLHQIYGPQFHLFLIGVSEVTRALAKFALLMDYRVSVCDPRPEQIAKWDIENVSLVQAMPDDAVLEHADDAYSAILALTHDPRIDDMGLLEAFNTKAFYIGAMGSMATSKKRHERLLSLSINESDLQRLHAPIGLNIGSKTPSEIAIAILAELTQVRSQKKA